ncbi:hypothetical protein E2C01_100906 [Portunus trituberculatus]|uniref:Uncharacterized protein n=1 Tax=Portunus trituberculatus TaxID=210409 RepID=A0A5B7KKN6_PORTR|nr:hypothetical protein [Portunus trituberculatus]
MMVCGERIWGCDNARLGNGKTTRGISSQQALGSEACGGLQRDVAGMRRTTHSVTIAAVAWCVLARWGKHTAWLDHVQVGRPGRHTAPAC